MRILVTLFSLISISPIYADYYVIIDPGHGGDDNGAGPTVCDPFLYEKDLNLDYGILTYNNIFFTYTNNWFPYITRDDDTFISLQDRADMANNEGGNWVDAVGFYLPIGGVDLFLSIHCNSFNDPNAHGTEALYYDDGGRRGDRSITSATITLLYYLEDTKQIFNNWDSRWIKDQNVYVLRETNMPATLIETEFISNNTSCEVMKDYFYKQAVKNGLSHAVWSIFPDEEDYVMKVFTSDITTLEWWYYGTLIFQNTNGGQEQYYYVENSFHIWDVDLFIDDNVHVLTSFGGEIILEGARVILGEGATIDVTVGIEDYIWITLDYNNYNVNQIYVGTNHRQFIDEWPYGDSITVWGPWKINASYGCGDVLIFETESESYINIPPLPECRGSAYSPVRVKRIPHQKTIFSVN